MKKNVLLLLAAFLLLIHNQENHAATKIEQEYCDHAKIYLKEKNYDHALLILKNACTMFPNSLPIRSLLAFTLMNTHQYEQAIEQFSYILLNSHSNSARINKAICLRRTGNNHQAMLEYEKALITEPNNRSAHLGFAFTCLATGNFEQGWYEYLWRHPMKSSFRKQDRIDVSTLYNKIVLIHREGEIGDNIQFIRYAQMLKSHGAYVVVQIHPALKKLFSLCNYINKIITIPDESLGFLPNIDIHIKQQNLPFALGSVLETIPAPVPYLSADSTLVAYWQHKLAQDKNFKVGICWQASPDVWFEKNPYNKRSIPLSLFEQLSRIPGISLYSLQKKDGIDQLQQMPTGMLIHDFKDELDTEHGPFMDTAAIITNLDLVITVDTAIAHLAGALGAPVWVLLPYAAEWRWMENRSDSPWYPTMRLFRQTIPQDWNNVINQIAHKLEKKMNKKNN